MTKKPHSATGLAKYIDRRVLELKPKKSQVIETSRGENMRQVSRSSGCTQGKR